MSEKTVRIFSCDAPGCRSYCDLGHAIIDEDVNLALEIRGWRVEDKKHYCPAHKTITTQETPKAE